MMNPCGLLTVLSLRLPSFPAITIPETANEFAIKGNHLSLVKGNQFDDRTKTDPYKHIHEFLRICDMFKYRDTKNEAVHLMMFQFYHLLMREAKTWLDELNKRTIKTWDELRTAFISRFFPPALFDRLLEEIRAFSQHENESLTDAWLRMKESLSILSRWFFLYKTTNQSYSAFGMTRSYFKLDWAKKPKTKSSLKKTVAFADKVIRVKQKQLNLRVGTERMIFNIDSAMKHSYSNDDTCFSIDVIDEILEEYFDALLDEGSKILHFIEGTLLEEEIFVIDEFMAMTADENSNSESDTEDPPFEKITINTDYKITINTDYKIKTSIEEPPTDLELKPLPDNLEYVFLEEPSFLPVIISSQLSKEKKNRLISVLKKTQASLRLENNRYSGIFPSFCKHKIQLLDDKKPVVQKQRRLNPNMQEVVKKEIMKLLDTGIIYPIADSPWVSPIHCVPKKGGITVVTNERKRVRKPKNYQGPNPIYS
ncbi:reverse transcriptase domain-containing protein [Tanacetum coccineum]